MSADQQIASYIFYNALKTCIYGDDDGVYVNQQINDSSSIDNMFAGQQHIINVGLLAENVASKFTPVSLGDGAMQCQSIAKAAFSMWGMTGENATSLYEAFGYLKPTNAYRCIAIDPRDDDALKPIQKTEATTIPFALSDYTLGTGAYMDEDGQVTTLDEYSVLCEQKALANNWYVYTDKNGNEITYEQVPEADKYYIAGADLITKFREYIKSKIFGITSYQGSEHGGNVSLTEPSLNDAQKYYYYKYYFVNENICNAKTYGLTSALESGRTTSEVANIRGGKINGQTYPYVEVPLIDNANGTLNTYSFIMESSKANNDESLPIIIDSKTSTTCSDVVTQLTNLSKNVSNEIINFGSNGVVYGKIVGDSLGLTAGGGQTEAENSDKSDGGEATCGSSITGVGWIVCPVVNALVALNDGAWKMIESMLVVNPLTQTGNKSYIYQGWEIIRNIANIAFVIIFLIIIFSQVTGFGINNYGIKKLLPKIIVGAILVNLSFFIMQIAVDLSNIVGKSLYNLILGAAPSIKIELSFQAVVNSILKASALNAATLGATAGSIALITTVGGPGTAFLLLLPGLAMAALALLAAIFTLVFRQAAIPILAMLAPLAFVAYLLPNTESWFKKWKKILIDALMLYPFAAVIFSGAKFVATVIIGDGSNWLSMMMGTIILVLPLGSLPFLASKGGALTDAVLKGANNMFGKLKSPISNLSKERAGYTKARFDNQAMNGKNGLFYGTRRMYMQNKLRQKTAMQNFERQTGKANSEYIISELEKGPGSKLYKQMAMKSQTNIKGQPNNVIYNSAAAKYNASIISNAISEREAMNQKEIGSIVSEFNSRNAGFDEIKVEMLKAIKGGDINRTRAMQNLLLNKGGAGKTALEQTYDAIYKGTKLSYTDKNGHSVEETLNSSYLASKNQETIRLNQIIRSDLNAANVKASNIVLSKLAAADSYSTDINTIANSKSTYEGLNASEFVGQSAANFERAIESGALTEDMIMTIVKSPSTRPSMDKDKWAVLENQAKKGKIPLITQSNTQ